MTTFEPVSTSETYPLPDGVQAPGDPELCAAARAACGRFFGHPPIRHRDLIATPWADPGHSIMADINKYMAMLKAAPPPPRLRIDVDAIALDCIRDNLGRQPADAVLASPFLSPLAALASIPIALDEGMPLGGWRIIDTDGNVRAEGNVLHATPPAGETM